MDTNRTDVLISRALDREAAPREWDELEGLLAREPATGLELARGLRTQAALEHALASELADLPALVPPAGTSRSKLRPLSGWIAASLLACGWTLSALAERGATGSPAADGASVELAQALPGGASPEASSLASALPVSNATAPAGEALGELPLVMVDSRALEDGGYEVLYLRRVLERARVDGLLELAADEHGEPRVVPAGGVPAGAGGEVL